MSVTIFRDPSGEELEFHWKSGRVSLDLVATVGERWRRSFERLLTAVHFARWIVQSGMLQTAPQISGRQLPAARALREAINRLARPGVEPEPGDRAQLNAGPREHRSWRSSPRETNSRGSRRDWSRRCSP